MNKEIRNAKLFISITFCIVIVLAIVFVGITVKFNNRPLDSSVTVEGIRRRIQTSNTSILAKANDCYYSANASDELSALFKFDDWELASTAPADEPVLSLRLAELWFVEFYSDGLVTVYNGYALTPKYKGSAYYSIPSEALQEIVAYLETKGTPHELGDGTIYHTTFYY